MDHTMAGTDTPQSAGTQLTGNTAAESPNMGTDGGNLYAALASDLIDEVDADKAPPAADALADEGGDAPADDAADDGLVDFELNGKTVRVPKEVQEGYLRQADYTRKTSEVAQQRQIAQQQAAASQTMLQFAQQYPHIAAQVHTAQAEYERLNRTDWNALRAHDPHGFTERVALLHLADSKRREALQLQTNAISHYQQIDAHTLHTAQSVAMKELSNEASPWAIKGVTSKVIADIDAYWTQQGLPPERMQRVASAMEVSILHDAMKYRQLKQQNPQAKQVSANSPAIVPQSQPVTQKGSAKGTTATANLLSSFQKNPSREGMRKLIALDL
jgi:hypothetical protein